MCGAPDIMLASMLNTLRKKDLILDGISIGRLNGVYN